VPRVCVLADPCLLCLRYVIASVRRHARLKNAKSPPRRYHNKQGSPHRRALFFSANGRCNPAPNGAFVNSQGCSAAEPLEIMCQTFTNPEGVIEGNMLEAT
jgi:hypothetical protein